MRATSMSFRLGHTGPAPAAQWTHRLSCVLWLYILSSGVAVAASEYTDDGNMGPRQEVQRWMINRSRYSPESQADLLGMNNSTAGGHPDYDCCEDNTGANDFGTTTANWDAWKATKGPLAANARLIKACMTHSLDMAQCSSLDHMSPSSNYYPLGSSPAARDSAEGYVNGISGYYENIGQSSDPGSSMAGFQDMLFTDYTADSRGHRKAILNSNAREIGIGLSTINGLFFTQDYGRRSGVHFFTDTIFCDSNSDNVYTEGEGVGNIEIHLEDNGVEGAWYDVSTTSGNFAIPIAEYTDGHTISVELVNKSGGTVNLHIPGGWATGSVVTIANNQIYSLGSFVQPGSDLNVGFRNLALFPVKGQITSQAATGITATSAVLNAMLACAGGTYGVRAYWNTVNGGTNVAAWTNSAYVGTWTNAALTNITCSITGLTPGTNYFFTFRATNATETVWANNVMSLTTIGKPVVTNSGTDNGDAVGALKLTGILSQGPADVVVFWGTADGGTNLAGWAMTNRITGAGNGSFQVNVSNLLYGLTYYYRCYATNAIGTAWATESASFATISASAVDYRMKISFTNYGSSEILTNFPVLLAFSNGMAGSGFKFNTFASTNGYDLRLWDSTENTNLHYEIESWSPGSCSYVWVQVPRFTNNCSIWATWGRQADTNRPAYTTNGATWASVFRGVWHLAETAANGQTSAIHYDSTTNHLNGQQNQNNNAAGMIGNGQFFDGASDWITVASKTALDVGSVFAFSGWCRWDGAMGHDWNAIANRKEYWTAANGWEIELSGYDDCALCVYGGGDTEAVLNVVPNWAGSGWHYVTVVLNGATASAYCDGVLKSSGTIAAAVDNTYPMAFGRNGDQSLWNGMFDEFRLQTGIPSSNWIWASYANMASNSWFNTAGTVIINKSSPSGLLSNSPATGITSSSALVKAALACSGSVYQIYAHWNTLNGGTNATLWTNSAYVGAWTNVASTNLACTAAGLTPDTTYYFTFRASNVCEQIWATNVLWFTTSASASRALQVVSHHGQAVPAAGNHDYAYGTVLTNWVISPETVGATQYVCTGWSMTGNGPASGSGTNMSLTITNNATLTWRWTTNYWIGFDVIGNQ